jgi:Transposase IS116/IS110/IS902 family
MVQGLPRSGCCAPCLPPSPTSTEPSPPACSATPRPSCSPHARIGEVNLAQIVAEVSPVLDRVDTAEQAIAECGAAPVTRASGKTKTVGFRWAANRRARTALHAFADNSRRASPWAAKLYADARRRGKHHAHAIRILARAWLRVMWACWHTDTAYDPAHHRAEQRLAA